MLVVIEGSQCFTVMGAKRGPSQCYSGGHNVMADGGDFSLFNRSSRPSFVMIYLRHLVVNSLFRCS